LDRRETLTCSLLVNSWNGNDSLWSLPGLLPDAVGSVDIFVITETHESPARPLLGFTRYQWLSICREEVRASGGVWGSGGVVCLIRDDIFSHTSLVHSDTFARFMWVHIDRSYHCQKDFFIASCYFPLASSHYIIHGTENGDPFINLSESIS